MSYSIKLLAKFKRAAKPLLKKYPSLKSELGSLQQQLLENPTLGTALGKGCYKIRLAVSSKGQGSSGGARVVTFVAILNEEIVLLTIYDKADRADLRPGELEELLKLLE
ncbi:type II toxin-antitoxin system RelE/ParE family toxin [Hymenobacter terricola]|uniref:type II toxin-antitoxin system RelE/ParE family toxin n=1 Tax=Hymenobacter terricola TaxID=2819236 RepID=UPI001B31882F|nr:type II toxin-antitoxin system RelE/ParE family toxin [Hymenobacter terricola]